jgi:hypothetical protein
MPWPLARRAGDPVAQTIFVAVVAATMFGLGIIVEGAGEAEGSEWLSFAGALLGAALTVAGSIAVLEYQRTSEIRARRALLLELLDDVQAACVPFQLANEAAVRERYGTTVAEKVKELQSAIRRVHAFRDAMKPKTALMMRVRDILADLSFDAADITGWLESMALYPTDADLGGLNAHAHNILATVDAARVLLKSD